MKCVAYKWELGHFGVILKYSLENLRKPPLTKVVTYDVLTNKEIERFHDWSKFKKRLKFVAKSLVVYHILCCWLNLLIYFKKKITRHWRQDVSKKKLINISLSHYFTKLHTKYTGYKIVERTMVQPINAVHKVERIIIKAMTVTLCVFHVNGTLPKSIFWNSNEFLFFFLWQWS